MLDLHARERLRSARAGAAAASLILAAAGYSATPASAQSLFETLFGARFQDPPPLYHPPQTYAPDAGYARRRAQPPGVRAPHALEDRRARRLRLDQRPASERSALVEPAKPAPYVAPPVMPGQLGRFLRDPTLRSGDVVATAAGLMVFRGSRGVRHAESDFAPLARAGGLLARETRAELARLDRALDARGAPEPPATPAPIVARDERGSRRR